MANYSDIKFKNREHITHCLFQDMYLELGHFHCQLGDLEEACKCFVLFSFSKALSFFYFFFAFFILLSNELDHHPTTPKHSDFVSAIERSSGSKLAACQLSLASAYLATSKHQFALTTCHEITCLQGSSLFFYILTLLLFNVALSITISFLYYTNSCLKALVQIKKTTLKKK